MQIRIETGKRAGVVTPIAGTVRIGRAPDIELCLPDPAVSRRHATIEMADGKAVLRDCGSANGLLVNGAKITEAVLASGDRVRVGDTYLVFSSEDDAATVVSDKDYPTRVEMERCEVASRLAPPSPLVGDHPSFLECLAKARAAAQSGASVLLEGETGTGKELLARAVHDWSARASQPFIPVNCASLPQTLLESELFGYERGAFTGANCRRPGKFELAHKGTLFLDEIAELSPPAEASLLRVLETGEFFRVGGTALVRVNVRLVAATNRNLAKLVKEDKFRGDLFYRLNVVEIRLPPLRERVEDIPLLAGYFLQDLSREVRRDVRLTDEALAVLSRYHYPGNIRQLRNILERAAVLAAGQEIRASDLPSEVLNPGDAPGGPAFSLAAAEKDAIVRALAATNWNKTEAVKLLGTSHPTLNKKIAEYGIKRN